MEFLDGNPLSQFGAIDFVKTVMAPSPLVDKHNYVSTFTTLTAEADVHKTLSPSTKLPRKRHLSEEITFDNKKMKCSSSPPTSMPTPADDNIQLSAIMNMINKLSDNFNSVATRKQESVNSDYNSSRTNDQRGQSTHSRTHNYSQQVNRHGEYTNEGRSFGDGNRRGRGFKQSRGLAETHLIGQAGIVVNGYTWIGNNRKQLHVRARAGSGGVALLVRNDVLSDYNVTKINDLVDGIIWIRFSERNNTESCFYICVVYLPPENSARSVNIHEFLDSLTSDIYTIPNGSPFYLCGDWNSRVADIPDFITGIDNLPERQVIDFTHNTYGDILCDFLSNVNCCILNGRNSLHNDFTYVSTRGASVVDYCIVPYEKLTLFDNFEGIRAQQLIDGIFKIGEYEPKHIPDHSLLCWTFSTQVCLNDKGASGDKLHTEPNKSTKFDTRNIPNVSGWQMLK
ncbi:unnamed protein product [Mytilus edulis]|uniref:Endonuclease/exonuclease/phosphatase domain-containing protein n=1 Tax=Mytilus edulis TaxID=6550 RepID=A0A8S3TLS6_MYTED|nr:unnamed protein product [Mytilus edulis]